MGVWILNAFYAHRGAVELVVLALLAVGAFEAYSLHERHRGAADCLQAAQLEQLSRAQRLAVDRIDQAGAINAEVRAYTAAMAAPVFAVPAVSLCQSSIIIPAGALRKAAPAGSSGPRGADVSAANRGNSAEPAGGAAALMDVGKRADAQIGMLLDYVQRVCTGPADR